LAFRYLEGKGMSAKYTQQGDLQIGKLVFKRLREHMGGYQKVDASDYQILLNYRSYKSPANFVPTVTLREILTGQLDPDKIKGRIILIGVTSQNSQDNFFTPYSADKSQREKIPGVIAQAQMVSQILSAVLDGRPLLWVWPVWAEVLWVWGWSIAGGAIAWHCRARLYLGLTGVVTLGILYGFCFGFMTQGGWLPLVPSALALVITGGCVSIYTRSSRRL
jgi:CHASE2 domain-containing sensor protein